MRRVGLLIDEVSRIKRVSTQEIVNSKAKECVFYRYAISWISVRVYGIANAHVASIFGVSARVVYHGCYAIDENINKFDDDTLDLLTDLLFKYDKAIRAKNNQQYSVYELRNMLKKLTDTRSCNCANKKNEEKKEPVSHSKRSFYRGSDFKWIKREIIRNEYLEKKWEINLCASAMLDACEWGRKCAYENHKRMEQLHDNPHILFIPTPD